MTEPTGADGVENPASAGSADSHDTTWLTPDPDTVRLGEQPTTVDPTVPPAPPVPPVPPVPPAPPAPAGWSSPSAPSAPFGQPGAPTPAPPSYAPPPASPAAAAPPPPPPPGGAWQQAAPMGAPGRPEWTGAALPGVAGWGAVQQAPKPGVVPLRPLGLGEILDGAVSYIRRDPRTVLGIATVIALVVAIAQFLATLFFAGSLLDGLDAAATAEDGGAVAGQLAGLVASTLIPSLLSFVLNIVAVGMLTVVMSQAVLGRRVTAREAWDRTSSAFWRLLGVTLLIALVTGGIWVVVIGLAVLLGFGIGQASDPALGIFLGFVVALAAVPLSVWLYIRWLLAPVVVVLERAGVLTSMRRSAALVRGSWWRILGIYLLATLIAGVVSQVISVPLGFLGGLGPLLTGPDSAALWLAFGTALAILVASIITIPFTAGVVSLLYIDRRIRREALDIELQRAAGVGGATG